MTIYLSLRDLSPPWIKAQTFLEVRVSPLSWRIPKGSPLSPEMMSSPYPFNVSVMYSAVIFSPSEPAFRPSITAAETVDTCFFKAVTVSLSPNSEYPERYWALRGQKPMTMAKNANTIVNLVFFISCSCLLSKHPQDKNPAFLPRSRMPWLLPHRRYRIFPLLCNHP